MTNTRLKLKSLKLYLQHEDIMKWSKLNVSSFQPRLHKKHPQGTFDFVPEHLTLYRVYLQLMSPDV